MRKASDAAIKEHHKRITNVVTDAYEAGLWDVEIETCVAAVLEYIGAREMSEEEHEHMDDEQEAFNDARIQDVLDGRV